MTIDWRQYARDHPRVVDAALIALLLCAAAGQAELNSSVRGIDGLGWRTAVPLAVAASVVLLWRRRYPRMVVGFAALCVCAEGAIGYLITPVNLAPVMVALYELAVRAPGRATRWCYLAVTVPIVASALVGNRPGYPWPLEILNPVAFLLLPVALAETARLRHAHAEQDARHRVAEERLRIARELHDVVAHHLALANAQAGTAAYLASTHPGQATAILTELTGTTSSALRELKATVGLLRQPGDVAWPLEPAPGLGRLAELTAAFGSAGLDVEVTVEGAERPLAPDVDLTAFRIVQEALTNVTKHAATGTARVLLTYGEALTITVTNDGDGPGTAIGVGGPATLPGPVRRGPVGGGEPGFGITGMRERALSAGGRFHAGPSAGGGFAVTTELPILVRS
jgi:signal transduction histidine kinase